MNPDYGEARFILALLSLIVTSVALFHGNINQESYVKIIAIILGLYTTHSVLDDKLRDRNQ